MVFDSVLNQAGGWSAPVLERLLDLPEPAVTEMRVRRDIKVAMPDGIHLATDHYRPPGLDPMPTVVFRTPYDKRRLLQRVWSTLLVRQGFQVVVQDTRGQFASDGRFDAFRQERADGLATAAWIRAQPWSDGTLATAGPSYLGHTQWAVAPYVDPPLAAMCPAITTANFTELFYPGGAFNLNNLLSWSATIGTQQDDQMFSALRRAFRGRRVRRAMTHLPLGEADNAAIGKPEPFWRTVTDHAEPGDGYWDEIDHTAALSTLPTPVSMVTGWWDLLLPGQMRDYELLQKSECPRRITIGPWDHSRSLKAAVTDSFSWLAAHVHGDTSILNRAPVRLYLQKAGRWLDFDRWPPRESTPKALFLQPGGELNWQAPREDSASNFTYDPADPTPAVGGALLDPRASGQRDNGEVEKRSDVLTFTSAPLPHELDLVGPVSAAVHVHTDSGYGDLFVRLCDVDRKGVSRNVTDGIVRLHEPSKAVEVALHPAGYRFGRGHRLRLQVSGGAFPNHARNNGTGEPLATARRITPIRYEIRHGPDHPSAVTLPLLG